jgi:hypothetical protein
MNPYPSDPPLGSSGEDRRDRVFGPSEAYVPIGSPPPDPPDVRHRGGVRR